MTEHAIGRGTVLAGRFRLEDLVHDTDGARFWRAVDQTLARSVAVNVLDIADPRGEALLVAARTSATVTEGHFLRVLDAAEEDGVVYVVHEWGNGASLDKILADGPLPARRAAWLVKEVADAITVAHAHGIAHGRLVPENVMVTEAGAVKLIGFVVDAVLHGPRQLATPDGRSLSDHESDVYNLASLLYATLVAKWPGTPDSRLTAAPRDHGRTLRPRQVRAGVPRSLDAICDQVLNPTPDGGQLETAHEVSAALSDFIGEATSAGPLGHEPTAVIDRDEHARFRPDETAGAPSGPVGGSDPEATQAAPWQRNGSTADPEATQAAGPIFDDGRAAAAGTEPTRRVAPPPPPPFPEPADRPLFAPGPRRSTADPRDPGTGGAVHGHHSTHGTGSLPAVWGPDSPDDDEDWDERDAGKDWLKLAAALAAIVALVLAIVFAFNLGAGSGDSPSGDPTEAESDSSAPAKPLAVAGIEDFDPPPKGNGEENGDEAGLAVDGDPGTAWRTLTYYGNPKLGLLKDGVGLVLDLGATEQVSQVEVTVGGRPTSLEILAAAEGSGPPQDPASLRQVARAQGVGGRTVLDLDEPVTTQYLVVWLTSLPPAAGGFQGQVSEIVVRP